MTKQHGIRQSRRISVLQEAEVLSGDRRYSGIIEDVSTTGLQVVVSTEKPDITFAPGNRFTVKFVSSDTTVQVQCEACWIRIDRNPSYGLTYRIALEMREQSESYTAYIKALR